jgi:hypothetical protein
MRKCLAHVIAIWLTSRLILPELPATSLVESIENGWKKLLGNGRQSMSISPEFIGFSKIPRLSREIIITEKIDGTNGQIYITEDGVVFAGSRTRFISVTNDHFNFAKFVEDNKEELIRLGPGHHFGEWWGQGINRGYGLKEKRFSLFNLKRWSNYLLRPSCCLVVPQLYRGPFETEVIYHVLENLRLEGSVAVPGYMRPEGIVIYHTAGNLLFKKTIENDEKGKE